ncbi:MAG: hypothetical protein HY927_09535 [Elusimicrobia bacterium]|nr:hypothetical protein [Elusimicrobiota bacterium]
MDHCKYCGCLGLFFGLNKAGLCPTCQHMVSLEVGLRTQSVREASKKVETTLNPQSKIAGLDIVVENLGALRKYEERGIPVMSGSPAALLKEARLKQQGIIIETARSERDELFAQVEKVPELEAKRRLYTAFLLRVAEYKQKLDEPDILDDLETQARRAVHQVQLSAVVKAALESEAASRKEEAARKYREAAEFLKKADVDEKFRREQMMKLNAKLKKLGKPQRPAP